MALISLAAISLLAFSIRSLRSSSVMGTMSPVMGGSELTGSDGDDFSCGEQEFESQAAPAAPADNLIKFLRFISILSS
jgi:hypothetical protein